MPFHIAGLVDQNPGSRLISFKWHEVEPNGVERLLQNWLDAMAERKRLRSETTDPELLRISHSGRPAGKKNLNITV